VKFYQACFTRVGGQGLGDGWQAVNFSLDAPFELISAFSRIQNSNIYKPEFDEKDSGCQIAMELQTDSSNVFLTYIKYGLQDQTGRPAMFANSLIFEANDFIRDPLCVLAVKSNNFRFDIESTRELLSDIDKAADFELDEALAFLNLNKDSYLALIRCVFQILDAKTKETLHIIGDYTEETVRKSMYCIYMAMPFAFRKKVSFATYSASGSAPKTIVFDRKLKSPNDLFFALATGENNVLSEALLKRLSRSEFIGYVPGSYQNLGIAEINQTFSIIEDNLARFGCAQSISLDLNKLAYETLLYETKSGLQGLSDEILQRRLNELLSVNTSQTVFLDEQINNTLKEAVARDLLLNDIISEKLCARLENTGDEYLLKTGNAYTALKIRHMSVTRGADFLDTTYQGRDCQAFSQIREALKATGKGRDILKHLYLEIIFPKTGADEESILNFFAQTRELPFAEEISQSLIALWDKYLRFEIRKKELPSILAKKAGNLLNKIFPGNQELVNNSLLDLKEAYWRDFSYEDLVLEEPLSYQAIRLDKNPKSDLVFTCLDIWKNMENNEIKSFCAGIKKFFTQKPDIYRTAEAGPILPGTDERRILLKKFIQSCINKNKSGITTEKFDMWLLLTDLGGYNKVHFLIKNRIISDHMLGSEELLFVIGNSRYLKDAAHRSDFADELSEYVHDKQSGREIASHILKIIKEIEKQTKRDSLEEEKARKKETREDLLSKTQDFIAGIGRNWNRKA
jgi:hypothetical protein